MQMERCPGRQTDEKKTVRSNNRKGSIMPIFSTAFPFRVGISVLSALRLGKGAIWAHAFKEQGQGGLFRDGAKRVLPGNKLELMGDFWGFSQW